MWYQHRDHLWMAPPPCRRRPATRDSQGLLHFFSETPTGFRCTYSAEFLDAPYAGPKLHLVHYRIECSSDGVSSVA